MNKHGQKSFEMIVTKSLAFFVLVFDNKCLTYLVAFLLLSKSILSQYIIEIIHPDFSKRLQEKISIVAKKRLNALLLIIKRIKSI